MGGFLPHRKLGIFKEITHYSTCDQPENCSLKILRLTAVPWHVWLVDHQKKVALCCGVFKMSSVWAPIVRVVWKAFLFTHELNAYFWNLRYG